MFSETDGSLAWLYSHPKIRSPLHTLNQIYDKVTILFKGQKQFVDPFIRQTIPDAMPQNCSDPIKNLLQMDFDQRDSWYSLTPEMSHRDIPAVFALKTFLPSLCKSFLNHPKRKCIRKDNSANFDMLS